MTSKTHSPWSEERIVHIIRGAFSASLADDLMSDGAHLPPCKKSHTRVISCDTFQETTDFVVNRHSPVESAGHRAITQNLSDLAAMGAKPVGFVWSLEIPSSWLDDNAQLLRGFCTGAAQLCQQKNLNLLGGDLSHSPHFACTTTILGDVRGKPLSRRGARPGDGLYLSRPIGASRDGLNELLNKKLRKNKTLIAAHIYPSDEIELGQALVDVATSCMDLSDGLGKDLTRLCHASNVNVELDNDVDLSAGAEDYALLFTGPEKRVLKLQRKLGRKFIRIGTIVASTLDSSLRWNDNNGGYDHFMRSI